MWPHVVGSVQTDLTGVIRLPACPPRRLQPDSTHRARNFQEAIITLTQRGLSLSAAIGLGIALLAGCASTAPKPKFSEEIARVVRLSSPDTVQVNVDAPTGVEILPEDLERLARKVKSKIDSRKVANASGIAGVAYEVDLHLSRYQKGNAFARAMLAGLGQIHVEGKIAVFHMPEHRPAGEFELKKTFAWGGAYGAGTSIEDIENTFADGVAAAVTGQQHEPPEQKP
jgi:hypothetical protein